MYGWPDGTRARARSRAGGPPGEVWEGSDFWKTEEEEDEAEEAEEAGVPLVAVVAAGVAAEVEAEEEAVCDH